MFILMIVSIIVTSHRASRTCYLFAIINNLPFHEHSFLLNFTWEVLRFCLCSTHWSRVNTFCTFNKHIQHVEHLKSCVVVFWRFRPLSGESDERTPTQSREHKRYFIKASHFDCSLFSHGYFMLQWFGTKFSGWSQVVIKFSAGVTMFKKIFSLLKNKKLSGPLF